MRTIANTSRSSTMCSSFKSCRALYSRKTFEGIPCSGWRRKMRFMATSCPERRSTALNTCTLPHAMNMAVHTKRQCRKYVKLCMRSLGFLLPLSGGRQRCARHVHCNGEITLLRTIPDLRTQGYDNEIVHSDLAHRIGVPARPVGLKPAMDSPRTPWAACWPQDA